MGTRGGKHNKQSITVTRLYMVKWTKISVHVRSVFGSVPCSCFHVFYFEIWLWFLFVSCFPYPHVLFAIGSLLQCAMFWLVVMFIVSCSHWFVLVMWPSLFVISSHVIVLFLVVYWLFMSCCWVESSRVESSRKSSLYLGLHYDSHYARIQWTIVTVFCFLE